MITKNKERKTDARVERFRKERIGQRRQNRSGLWMEVIDYPNSENMTVKFDIDGLVVNNVCWSYFDKGWVPHREKLNIKDIQTTRIGRVNTMNDGSKATIVAYRTANDIDVQFENGIVLQNVTMRDFKAGYLSLTPRHQRIKNDRITRVGETVDTKYGKCTIIKYINSNDVHVQFDDGTIVMTTYANFKKGAVRNPSVKCNKSLQEQRLGQRAQMKSGLWAEVIEYFQSDDISVKFDIDGYVATHTTWRRFQDGSIGHPTNSPEYKKRTRIGEIREMNNHLLAKIINYRGIYDIDVEFVNDGATTKTSYKQFINGEIAHPTKCTKRTLSIGEFSIAYYLHRNGFVKINKGEWRDLGFGGLELDFYNPTVKVAIEFDGAIHGMWDVPQRDIVKNNKCKELGITLYRLRHYDAPILNDGNSTNYILNKENELEKRGIFDCKQELETIFTKHNIPFNSDDINFTRDLNDIITQYKHICIDYYENRHIGETSIHKRSGQTMTIVAYKNSEDIEIEFSDGTRKSGVIYAKFKKGYVKHPNYMLTT